MRIDSRNKPDGPDRAQAKKAERAAESKPRGPRGSGAVSGRDSLELSGLSSAARELAVGILSEDGTYQPDPERTAQAMLDRFADA